jgi:thiosulfate dehydrogenase
MLKALVVGLIFGVVLTLGGLWWFFSSGHAPVATSDSPLPFERKLANASLDAYLERQPKSEPAVPADEKNLLVGAEVYKQHCAVCHGLPSIAPTAISQGMFPKPPQLFDGVGVTDDPAWETYWKAANGIRLTGMPGFKGRLTDSQIWQVSQLLANADKVSPTVKAALAAPIGAPAAAPAPAQTTNPVVPTK